MLKTRVLVISISARIFTEKARTIFFILIHFYKFPLPVEDTLKLINTLKSPNQPLIKKRQIMRTSFGDYRAKMAEEERTMALAAGSVGFDAPKKKAKYHFVKKAAVLSGERDFRFNFANIQLDDGGEGSGGAKREENGAPEATERVVVPGCGVIAPSDNTFRFNFSVEN